MIEGIRWVSCAAPPDRRRSARSNQLADPGQHPAAMALPRAALIATVPRCRFIRVLKAPFFHRCLFSFASLRFAWADPWRFELARRFSLCLLPSLLLPLQSGVEVLSWPPASISPAAFAATVISTANSEAAAALPLLGPRPPLMLSSPLFTSTAMSSLGTTRVKGCLLSARWEPLHAYRNRCMAAFMAWWK